MAGIACSYRNKTGVAQIVEVDGRTGWILVTHAAFTPAQVQAAFK